MNTNQLKKFAKEARIKLITQIGVKLDFVLTQDTAELRGKSSELAQLRSRLSELGREQLIETVAYTWFNRLMALRFMDANGYNTPKVVTPQPGMSNPEILQNALAGNVEEDLKLDRQRLNDLIDGRTSSSDAQTEAFKLLLVASCNKWHTAMPFMFERISDYTELLLPDDLLSDFSIVSDIRNGMSDEDCQQEELIGWLYQFYISDKKDDVFEGLKKNIKITAENIPAATQLFTPRWIVRYMVENTLGKLWLTFKPESKIRQHMPYFIAAPVGNNPTPLPEGIKSITDITFLDPCQGSGHILVYAFELFSKIYEEEGYNTNEIPSLIIQHNLFGIDIDERAAQLAAFALTMKARSYYSRFLRKPVLPNLISLENVNEDFIKQTIKLPLNINGKIIYEHRDLTLFNLTNAKNFGSLIKIDPVELNALQVQKGSIWESQELKLKVQAEFLSNNYHCIATNPPYMGVKGMNDKLKNLLLKHYQSGKADLYAAFILRCQDFLMENGYSGMVTMESWMFLSSFEELRRHLIKKTTINSLSHFGWHIMRIAFGTCSYIIQKRLPPPSHKGIYSYLEIEDINREKEVPFVFPKIDNGRYNIISQNDFEKIPGSPLGYWLNEDAIKVFESKTLYDYADPRLGMATADNSIFVRFFWEVELQNCNRDANNSKEAIESGKKWFLYAKGGDYRKWYGNNEYVVNWYNNGNDIRNFSDQNGKIRSHNYNLDYIFKPGITWNALSSSKTSFRILNNSLFDNAGSSLFPFSIDNNYYILGILNSKITDFLIPVINPTLNYQPGTIGKLPIKIVDKIKVEKLVESCILLCKEEQKTIETSIDFERNIIYSFKSNLIEDAIKSVSIFTDSKRAIIRENEKEINEILIEIYSLKNEIIPDVSFDDTTIYSEFYSANSFSSNKLIISLLSNSVGCLLGRYSVNKLGIIIANCSNDENQFYDQIENPTFIPDEDNIIPVLDDEWFTDDIVGRFKVFLKSAFGEQYFEENLRYIEETIEKDIRKYFVKDFYNDHIKRYKKRPIYWMFSSPKGHFKALIYMHRYQPDLCSKMLNDYLQPFINKLEAAKQTKTILSLREDVSGREKTLALKEVDRLELMIRDCKDYERTLFTIATQKITIDLDDGVKVNYLKFKDVLVPIKGLEKEED